MSAHTPDSRVATNINELPDNGNCCESQVQQVKYLPPWRVESTGELERPRGLPLTEREHDTEKECSLARESRAQTHESMRPRASLNLLLQAAHYGASAWRAIQASLLLAAYQRSWRRSVNNVRARPVASK